MLVVSMLMMVIPAVALRLEPEPKGFGTHQQLGLPECLFRQMFGLPCPHCGMTTSFSHLVRGQVGSAMRANPMGILLAALLGCLCTVMLWSGLTGRRAANLNGTLLARIGLTYLVMSILLWLVRIPFW